MKRRMLTIVGGAAAAFALAAGDVVSIEISGIGRLTNLVEQQG